MTDLPRIARRRSAISGWGVYAAQPIDEDTRIVAYKGELVPQAEAWRREQRYLPRQRIWIFTINTRWDDAGYVFDAAIPVDKTPEKAIPADAPVQLKQTYSGKALKIVFKGPYGGMPPSYQKLEAYMAARGYEAAGPPWDEYVSDPGTTPEAELITNIYQPVKS